MVDHAQPFRRDPAGQRPSDYERHRPFSFDFDADIRIDKVRAAKKAIEFNNYDCASIVEKIVDRMHPDMTSDL